MVTKNIFEILLDKFTPWLKFSPELVHEKQVYLLHLLCLLDEASNNAWQQWDAFSWKQLNFPNRIGIAGGVDKTGANINNWWQLGAGFVEVGTITPKYQQPNPGKIIARDQKNLSLWNKMGFPHPGFEESLWNLEKRLSEKQTPILVNIGKNRWTPNEKAQEDYQFLIHELHSYADIFVVNISSPNTQGLRDLFKKQNFKPFIKSIYQTSKEYKKPILLKLSPDENEESFDLIVDLSLEVGFDGFILTNTTTQRTSELSFPTDGGVSGKFLAPFSKLALQRIVKHLGTEKKNKLIINAGGVFNYEDYLERRQLGADLVQLYSGIVFNGPYIFKKIAREHFLKYN
ncbi:MAG: quinone-dependent dihydroorotate dehydrogenase [Bdellovibrionaceae bacterium]|nr:quinone-dependent dihydroorotate dehydrogenase [Pseudobdellovibrionaceae bacterium]NUM59157.1 quinone-dependent dihydroorotate dehydrogenase [Pseudobdellovibrionaceae bacterium]